MVHFAKSACLVFIFTMTLFKLLQCTVAKPLICCSCFCNEQLNKNLKCGKEYFTLNVSNIVLFIFKSFITFCWGKKEEKKKSHIKSQSQYFGKKNRNYIIFPNRSALFQRLTHKHHSSTWSCDVNVSNNKMTNTSQLGRRLHMSGVNYKNNTHGSCEITEKGSQIHYLSDEAIWFIFIPVNCLRGRQFPYTYNPCPHGKLVEHVDKNSCGMNIMSQPTRLFVGPCVLPLALPFPRSAK